MTTAATMATSTYPKAEWELFHASPSAQPPPANALTHGSSARGTLPGWCSPRPIDRGGEDRRGRA